MQKNVFEILSTFDFGWIVFSLSIVFKLSRGSCMIQFYFFNPKLVCKLKYNTRMFRSPLLLSSLSTRDKQKKKNFI